MAKIVNSQSEPKSPLLNRKSKGLPQIAHILKILGFYEHNMLTPYVHLQNKISVILSIIYQLYIMALKSPVTTGCELKNAAKFKC